MIKNLIAKAAGQGKGLPEINMNREMIGQVLGNLIDNAIKYNKERGNIKIRARKLEDFMMVSVSDTGIGIKEKDMGKLFKPLTQLDPSSKRKYGGTGTGLAVAKRIVESHGGKIWAESEFGWRSNFYFSLPV